MNDDQLERALDFVREATRLSLAEPSEFYRGVRFGAVQALACIGFGEAALAAIREVYEDENKPYPPIEEGVLLAWIIGD